MVTLVAFYHFAVVREQVLTPSIAFTSVRAPAHTHTHSHKIFILSFHSIFSPDCRRVADGFVMASNWAMLTLARRAVFSEMKFALNALPETLINMLQVPLARPRARLPVPA